MVNGFAGAPDMARLVCMFQMTLIALECEWYEEWIPSKANLADIVTRPERFNELLEGLCRFGWYREANPGGPRWCALRMPP